MSLLFADLRIGLIKEHCHSEGTLPNDNDLLKRTSNIYIYIYIYIYFKINL